jgi:hypothetical protein
MLTKDSINWRYLLSHPSEFVRIDEQLRLLEISIRATGLQEKYGPSWSFAVEHENFSHLRIIGNFRRAINLFGSHYFNVEILSQDEQLKQSMKNLKTISKKNKTYPNYFEDYHMSPIESFSNFIDCIAIKKNTEKIFLHFLVFIFDNYVNVNNPNPLLFQTDNEKEQIMLEIIQRIVN